MNVLEMEIKIYEEVKIKVLRGDYNGRTFSEELRSGNYLNELEAKNIDNGLFQRASEKVKENLLQGFEKKLENSNFVIKKLMLSVKFGTYSLNKSFVEGFEPHIERLKRDLENERIEDAFAKKPKALYKFPERHQRVSRDFSMS